MRVLAFEDSYDLEAMLTSAEIKLDGIVFLQRWNSSKPLEAILEFKPDVLLLDFFMPPFNGAQVLEKVIEAAEQGSLSRPKHIIGISSEAQANSLLEQGGPTARSSNSTFTPFRYGTKVWPPSKSDEAKFLRHMSVAWLTSTCRMSVHLSWSKSTRLARCLALF